MTYLDTSALVKGFVAEPGSPVVRGILVATEPVVTATIAYAEIHAAFWRRQRAGDLTRTQHALASRQFEREWHAYLRVELREEILRLARDLIRRHPLREFDAIHLASAVSLTRTLGEETTFVAADRALLRAARAERLAGLNPEAAPGR